MPEDQKNEASYQYTEENDDGVLRKDPLDKAVDNIKTEDRLTQLVSLIASAFGLFGLFFCIAEKKDKAIRYYAVQSVTICGISVVVWLAMKLAAWLLGLIPVIGILIAVVCSIVKAAVLLIMLAVRVKLMFAAYKGTAYDVPIVWESVAHYV